MGALARVGAGGWAAGVDKGSALVGTVVGVGPLVAVLATTGGLTGLDTGVGVGSPIVTCACAYSPQTLLEFMARARMV